jgi:hypothetical protein
MPVLYLQEIVYSFQTIIYLSIYLSSFYSSIICVSINLPYVFLFIICPIYLLSIWKELRIADGELALAVSSSHGINAGELMGKKEYHGF